MTQVGFILDKIKRAANSGTLVDKAKRYTKTRVKRPFQVVSGYINSSIEDRKRNFKDGFLDHRQNDGHILPNPDHIRRIITAYKKSKADQKNLTLPYQIRGLWAEWLAVNYRALIKALEEENIGNLSNLFDNLFREQLSNGAGGYDNYIRSKSVLGNLYIRHMWNVYRDKYEEIGGNFNEISFPLIGNPLGAIVDDKIISYETLRHAYRGKEICDLLKNEQDATIVEIGGGLGGEAYQTMIRNQSQIKKYLLFDIPEIATISAFFLLSAFPDKKIRLYGEGKIGAEKTEDFDIGIFPHYTIPQLSNQSVDLFYNSCSFSEMDGVSSNEYLKQIERIGKKYFLHVNHDKRLEFNYPDGSNSINIIGSELIPDETLFKRIYKKQRVHLRLEDFPNAHEYLYERL